MIDDAGPLKYVGTQDQETLNRAAAGSKMADAASWALGKAKDALQTAVEQARERATTALATRTQRDPVRAALIAAGTGALLMGLIGMMARSGVRKVKRIARR